MGSQIMSGRVGYADDGEDEEDDQEDDLDDLDDDETKS